MIWGQPILSGENSLLTLHLRVLLCLINTPLFSLGMHKKSVEAAATLETEDPVSGPTNQKSDSIAALRARAKEHNAKLVTALCGEENSSSAYELPEQTTNQY